MVSELTNAVESTHGRSYNKALASTRSDIAIPEEDAEDVGEDAGVEEDYYNTTMDDNDEDMEDVLYENESSLIKFITISHENIGMTTHVILSSLSMFVSRHHTS